MFYLWCADCRDCLCGSNSPVFCFPTFSVVSVNVKAGERRSPALCPSYRLSDFSCPFYFTTPGRQSGVWSLHLNICNSTKTVCPVIFLVQTVRSEHKVLLHFGLKLTNRTKLTDMEKTVGKSVKFTFDLFSLFSLMKMSEMKTNHVQPSIAQHTLQEHTVQTPSRRY